VKRAKTKPSKESVPSQKVGVVAESGIGTKVDLKRKKKVDTKFPSKRKKLD